MESIYNLILLLQNLINNKHTRTPNFQKQNFKSLINYVLLNALKAADLGTLLLLKAFLNTYLTLSP